MTPVKRKPSGWMMLLAAPFVGMLWVPFYNQRAPEIDGIPYFYWYQLVWIAASAAITAVVYFATRKDEP
jgi:Protein of unknown function (DUF3311)